MTKPANPKRRHQSERFTEAARELGCDESEEKFDAALKKVAEHKGRSDKAQATAAGKKTKVSRKSP